MADNETHIEVGVIKAITWLRAMGRPILAAKMERELLCKENHNSKSLPAQSATMDRKAPSVNKPSATLGSSQYL